MLKTVRDACQLHPMALDYTMTDAIENLADSDAATPSYVPAGEQQPEIPAPNIASSEARSVQGPALAECLKPVSARIDEFIKSEDQALLVSGMIGTGADQLFEDIVSRATSNDWNCLVLAPNWRMADHYPVEAKSLYSHIYSSHLRTEEAQLVYDLAENHDPERQMYVIGDCHLVSDSKFETDVLRFGSGQLLTDLLRFVNLAGSRRKIIFIGDPFQMTRGKFEETALSAERVSAIAEVKVNQIDLDHLLPEMANDPFVKNCVELAELMCRGVFNRLQLRLDESNCIETPHDPGQRVDVVRQLISELPSDCKFVAFSHGEVNRLNAWVRRNIFNREGPLTAGDLVHIHNGFYVTSKDELARPFLVANDSFAEVVSVASELKPIVQSLRGRQSPIVVPLVRVQARILDHPEVVEFLCLKDYLYSEKPEVDVDTLLALRVFAESRYRQLYGKQLKSSDSTRNDSTEAPDSSEQRAHFLRNDPYLNAARMRFGYALTLHRAQGRRFDTVIANLDTGQGQTNDAYIRWLYTLFTVPLRALYLSNVPTITPLAKASWDDSRSRLDSVRPTNLVPYDPGEGNSITEELKFSIEEKELWALYRFIDKAIKRIGCQVEAIEHHSYQEVYEIRSADRALCKLRLFFNKRFQVTRIETVDSRPPEFAAKVIESLTDDESRFENVLQKELYTLLNARLESCGIAVSSIDHTAYQEVYYLKTASGNVKLQIHYDGDGFVTRLLPVAHTNVAAIELVRKSLGF
jgi:hypothetical protein